MLTLQTKIGNNLLYYVLVPFLVFFVNVFILLCTGFAYEGNPLYDPKFSWVIFTIIVVTGNLLLLLLLTWIGKRIEKTSFGQAYAWALTLLAVACQFGLKLAEIALTN